MIATYFVNRASGSLRACSWLTYLPSASSVCIHGVGHHQ